MAKVTLLLGLGGSGKSYRAQELAKRDGAQVFEGIMPEESSATLQRLVNSLRQGAYCVVEEIALCHPQNQDWILAHLRAEVPGVEIEWICFENDLESANWNVRHRTNKGSAENHAQFNQVWHGLYKYPHGATVVPIVRTKARDDA